MAHVVQARVDRTGHRRLPDRHVPVDSKSERRLLDLLPLVVVVVALAGVERPNRLHPITVEEVVHRKELGFDISGQFSLLQHPNRCPI